MRNRFLQGALGVALVLIASTCSDPADPAIVQWIYSLEVSYPQNSAVTEEVVFVSINYFAADSAAGTVQGEHVPGVIAWGGRRIGGEYQFEIPLTYGAKLFVRSTIESGTCSGFVYFNTNVGNGPRFTSCRMDAMEIN